MQKATTIQTLRVIVDDKVTEREVLVQRVDDLDSSIESLLDSIQAVEMADDRIVTAPQTGTVQEVLLSFLLDVLQTEGPQHRQVLLDRAQAQGIHIGGRDRLNQMSSYLSKDARFNSDGQGHWRLTDDA